MLRIGITGGIGSGKTTVCAIFSTLGIPIYNSDERAKKIMVENQSVVNKLKAQFGSTIYFEDGSINRVLLSQIVFNDKEQLTKLNEIVHPAVFEDMIKWYAQNQNHKYVLQEAAIMYESGSYKMLDKTILVYADQEIRIERVMKRDKVDRIAVLARMDKQMPESEKLKLADFVIYNNGESLIDQVMKLHHTILELV
ncbi:MAG: dephospho-CoA kinase [Bacteroidetes bacterium]|nr:dephospho-CoA kinase [Bacteroidota bacterium]MBK8672905.1 dephospho-CoA kinase [Bacteroidota bacterium]MBK9352910.1 dephospho-CoA kinase [Bacteroidota bacterium]MBL0077691.1 dephospho-CoA kinase [Bacteroidota bacterium]MBL0287153.1 dephospho-CoA kinase [Bacteroidota bacterium]